MYFFLFYVFKAVDFLQKSNTVFIPDERLCLARENHLNEVLDALDGALGRHAAKAGASARRVVITTRKGNKIVIVAVLQGKPVFEFVS